MGFSLTQDVTIQVREPQVMKKILPVPHQKSYSKELNQTLLSSMPNWEIKNTMKNIKNAQQWSAFKNSAL